MDPLIILVASIFVILLASFIVNFYYIHGHYLHQMDSVTTTTQTIQNISTATETQANNQKLSVGIHDKTIQNVQITKTVGVGNSNSVQVEHCVQMEKVYYVTLPEQLDQISEQLKINRADLTHCMEWVGDCKKAALSMVQAVDQQSQVIRDIHENTQADIHQELQRLHANILQDVQFQLNLQAETFEQNHILHTCQQEAHHPLWELLLYQHHTQYHQQYWNRRTRQDQFWCNIREQTQHGPPAPPLPPHESPMPDLED